jgi:hypothetical protein
MAFDPEQRAKVIVDLDLDGVKFTRVLVDDLAIDGADINGEFMNQSELFAWWATVSELAKDKVNRIKFQLDRIYALKDHAVRLELTANKAKITEKVVENAVISSKEYQECMLELLESKKQYGLLQVGKEALTQRKDMLISLGANMRTEGGGNLHILKEAAKQRAAEAASEKKGNKKPPVGK